MMVALSVLCLVEYVGFGGETNGERKPQVSAQRAADDLSYKILLTPGFFAVFPIA
jgi:hypothetical protein